MAGTRLFRVHIHQETEGWWAESLDAPGFTAAGGTRDELDQQVAEGLRFLVGDETTPFVTVYLFDAPHATEAGFAPAPQQRKIGPHEGANFEARGVSTPTSANVPGEAMTNISGTS